MNNRHRRVARLKKQLEHKNTEIVDLSKAFELVAEALVSIKKATGAVLESFGNSLIKIGRSLRLTH